MTKKKKAPWVVRKERPMQAEITKRVVSEYLGDDEFSPQQKQELIKLHWNDTCNLMIKEFTDEGLTSTVELIKQCKI